MRCGQPGPVVEVQRETASGADAVWAVLADGWRLASWVVGAARVDAVDATWPAVGARLRYRIGAWPGLLPGAAEVTACRAGRELALRGHTPLGGIAVRLLLEPGPAGTAALGASGTAALGASGTAALGASGTVLRMAEDVVSGPARLVPARLRAGGIAARNVETLRRLALLAEAAAP